MLKPSQQFIIELDGVTYKFSNHHLEQTHEIKDIDADCWLISDLDTTISRTMIVEAEIKYVELMVRRNLQESGEFDEPVSIITHWKKKKGTNTTEIFFTALPTRLFHKYQDLIFECEGSVLLFPIYSVIYSVLKKNKSTEPMAVIFQHNRFADLIIGTNKRVYYANRCVSFDTSEEQMASLWETINTDIKTVETDNRIQVTKIITLNWIDSYILPEWPDKECEYNSFKDETILFDEETQNISLLNAARTQSGFNSISPLIGKISFYAKKYVPYVYTTSILLILLLIGGYFRFHHKTDMLAQEIRTTTKQINDIQAHLPIDMSNIDYKDTLLFIRNLTEYKNAPSYKSIINDLSEAYFSDLKFEVLKMDYSPGAIQMEIFGKIDAPFERAHKGYQFFITVLKKRGYIIEESRFNTEIKASQFLMTLSRRI